MEINYSRLSISFKRWWSRKFPSSSSSPSLPPLSKSILQVFRSTSVQSSAIEDFQVAAMFSLYRAMSGTRSHRLPFLSLSSFHSSFSLRAVVPATRLFHLLQKQWYFNGCARSTFNLAPVNENSNFIIAGLSGQGQWRSIMGVVLRAQYYTTTLAFRHRAWWFFNRPIHPDV